MQDIITIIVSVAAVALSAYFGLKNNRRTDTKDIEERVKGDTRINMKLDSISSTTQEIRDEMHTIRDDVKSHNDRIIKLEESVKSSHHRLDTIEERLNEHT